MSILSLFSQPFVDAVNGLLDYNRIFKDAEIKLGNVVCVPELFASGAFSALGLSEAWDKFFRGQTCIQISEDELGIYPQDLQNFLHSVLTGKELFYD